MGYFSELDTTKTNERMETEPAYLEKLKSRLCYLEDKLDSLESNRAADIWHDEIFADALPLYDYDEPDTASGLCKAISNIKEKIEELVKKLTSDKNLMTKFERNPVSVIEELIGIDLPDAQINQLIDGIKAKIKLDQVGDVLGGIGKLFGK